MKRVHIFSLLILLVLIFRCNGDLLYEGSSEDFSVIKLRSIWIAGGLSGDGTTNGLTTVVSSIDMYDPETGTWYADVTDIPTPVSFAAIASANGRIYVIGGFQGDGTPAALNQIYDVLDDSWSSGSVTNFTACANVCGAVSDNRIYILGGTTGNASAGWAVPATVTQCYNITSDSWITGLTAFGSGANRLAMSYNGVIYNMGGRSAVATLVSTHDGYTCSSNTLTSGTETALTSTRIGMAGVVYRYDDGYLVSFVLGGATAITSCSTCYIFNNSSMTYTPSNLSQYMYYSPSLVAWASGTNLPVAAGFGSAAAYGTDLYFFGGNSAAATGSSCFPVGSAGVYRLDIGSRGSYGSWVTAEDMPHARFGHASVTINQ